MRDPDGIVPQAFKDIAEKIGKNLVKGQITDISRTPAPAYLHHPFSQMGLLKNDFSFCRELKKAANA